MQMHSIGGEFATARVAVLIHLRLDVGSKIEIDFRSSPNVRTSNTEDVLSLCDYLRVSAGMIFGVSLHLYACH